MSGAVDKQQVVCDTDKQEVVGVIGSREVLSEPEGDISLSPDGRWLVNGVAEGQPQPLHLDPSIRQRMGEEP
jgi:hypothetical protein